MRERWEIASEIRTKFLLFWGRWCFEFGEGESYHRRLFAILTLAILFAHIFHWNSISKQISAAVFLGKPVCSAGQRARAVEATRIRTSWRDFKDALFRCFTDWLIMVRTCLIGELYSSITMRIARLRALSLHGDHLSFKSQTNQKHTHTFRLSIW